MDNPSFLDRAELFSAGRTLPQLRDEPGYTSINRGDAYKAGVAAYIAGGKDAAALTQELGFILVKYIDFMSPGDQKKCQDIFTRNKEIVDEQ